MSKQDCIKMDGTVIADKSNSIFDVELDNNSSMVIRCTLAGKIRMNRSEEHTSELQSRI